MAGLLLVSHPDGEDQVNLAPPCLNFAWPIQEQAPALLGIVPRRGNTLKTLDDVFN
ncbi:hypothetical protein H6G04_22230 [Calothrix membranacea FACHB-236]|nr:hypothetical protein [Calothrix membranacea FACHB-236]